mgnify:CR=1 FL=1
MGNTKDKNNNNNAPNLSLTDILRNAEFWHDIHTHYDNQNTLIQAIEQAVEASPIDVNQLIQVMNKVNALPADPKQVLEFRLAHVTDGYYLKKPAQFNVLAKAGFPICLLYTSDAADES